MSDEDKKAEETKEETPAKEESSPLPEGGAEGGGSTSEEAKTETPDAMNGVPTDEKPEQDVTADSSGQPTKKNPAEAWVDKVEGAKEIKPGMTVRVHERITDVNSKGETKERIQIFEGIILYIRNAGISRTMTVRKISKGFGVEKIYPVNSPIVAKIEVIRIAKVRRANLRYLGNLKRRFKRKLKETRLERKKK